MFEFEVQGSEYPSASEYSMLLNIPGFWNMFLLLNVPRFWVYQGSEYAMVLNAPLVFIISGFSIYQGSEHASVT